MNIKDVVRDYKGSFDIKNEKRVIIYKTSKARREVISDNLSKRKEVIPFHMNIPGSDVIKGENGDPLTIGFVTKIDPDKQVRFGTIAMTQQNSGMIMIDPKKANARQTQLYYYLQNTDFNGSKKDRDETKDILFYRIDKEGDAMTVMANKILQNKAENLFLALNDAEAANVIKVLGDHNLQNEPLQVQKQKFLMEYIPRHPKVFIEKMEDKNMEVDAKLRDAAKRGIIDVVKKDGQVLFHGEVILTFKNTPGTKIYEDLIKELKDNDPETLEAIIGKLNQAIDEESA